MRGFRLRCYSDGAGDGKVMRAKVLGPTNERATCLLKAAHYSSATDLDGTRRGTMCSLMYSTRSYCDDYKGELKDAVAVSTATKHPCKHLFDHPEHDFRYDRNCWLAHGKIEDMCNGSSTRVAQGGSIAVIRPVPTRAAHDNQPQIHGSFYFRDGSGVGTTDAIFEADDESSRRAIDGCICVIQ